VVQVATTSQGDAGLLLLSTKNAARSDFRVKTDICICLLWEAKVFFLFTLNYSPVVHFFHKYLNCSEVII
jgi:hypothetical protein